MGVSSANFVGHGQNLGQFCFVDARVAIGFCDGGENVFGADVADQFIAGEGTAPESG